MISLEETLAVLLGADGEARRIVQEARDEAESMIARGQEEFMRQRDMRISAAKQRAAALIDNAQRAAQAEAEEILNNGRARRERMRKAFEENGRRVASAIALEEAEALLSGRRGA
ncbi:ATP synthase F0 subunit B [Thermanaerovibrio acidaminovorans]|uniref:ATP synthase F0, B subunit n=1 Tax=Thermanaerovibrio acidaminovorans (strain ATCC 49978 / DSM 6589 / Su883) TaxID=525903 RepID=D1B906_THEAS|nr:ATP synthase F0 subunit B [Thermanaerovibrio acidaminovorans]ACZ18759.1 ATP synthase F0, B subunit [Thermanaerovibrio acidaminovorans DSM 6589]